jgi:Uma2 family endonuclease
MRQVTEYDQVSYEEYLQIEKASRDVRHEYVAGYLYAMVGANRLHNQIAFNLRVQLTNHIGDRPCQVVSETTKVRTPLDDVYYPDVAVTCDPSDSDLLVISRPCLVAEVLSPSTAQVDRREKLRAYEVIPSLQCYLVVYQEEQRVQRYSRAAADEPWETELITDGMVRVPCPVEAEFPLSSLYVLLPPLMG